ncbi:hypothetical protein NA57DRAFT_55445 [Rhizodiscina lignyota]|uniref:Zn(2)-C6 fungal-type domain-containing protein n=1 Tax=Rhizodiscina lignyota TaxID=1504668 RepID=A0A9P4IHP3_9PEZI|nr:hypothetical protein NA57DRAFT_55445 [Rhizodiscina lignyota]
MVYCGKPSKSCEACRTTKTKCDKGLPSCGQCIRLGRLCPGYRDVEALLFRNETNKTVRRARYGKRSDTVSELVSPYTNSYAEYGVIPGPGPPPSSARVLDLPPSLRDQAIGLFFHQLSAEPGCINYIKPVYRTFENGFLEDLFESIGLAFMSASTSGNNLMSEAWKKYASVLRSVNTALGDMGSATSDETLIAVLLLALFESITCDTPRSLRSWDRHCDGATAIVNARGTEQFQSELGLKVFYHVRDYLMIQAYQKRVCIPRTILELACAADAVDPTIDIAEKSLFHINASVCSLRHQETSTNADPSGLLSFAKCIDEEFENWVDTIPDHYKFTIVPDNSPDTLNGLYHTYPSFAASRIWNIYRCGRILTQEVVVRQLLSGQTGLDPWSTSSQLQSSRATTAQLCADICASVPSFLKSGSLRAATGHALLWPLYVVATTTNVEPSTRSWVVTELREISRRTAVLQGMGLADALSMKWEITLWSKNARIETVEDDNMEW